MLLQRGEERRRAGEEPLLERLQHELRGEPLGGSLRPIRPQLGVAPENGVDLPLLVGVGNLDRLQDARRETADAQVVEGEAGIALEATDHHRLQLLPIRRGSPREPLVVEQFQQRPEALLVAVVRRGRQEELVLEVRGQLPERLRPKRVGGVAADPGRGAVVGFVADQQVVPTRVDRFARCGQSLPKEAERALPLEKVDARDQPREVRPGVDVDASSSAQVSHQLRIDDAEVEAELVPHLVPPLDLQSGRADDQDLPGPMTDHQLQGHHPGLDRLAEAHVVGDQEVDPGHLDRPDHGVELVILDLDAAAERGLDVLVVGRRGGPPTHGVQEGVERPRLVEPGPLGQGHFLDHPGPRLDFPDDLQLLAQTVILDGGER